MTLKKTFVATCVSALCIGASGASAQTIGGGVLGGVSIATIPNLPAAVGEPGMATEPRVGLAIGGFTTIRWNARTALEPQVIYVQKGITLGDNDGPFGSGATVALDYVEVPLLVSYRFRDSGRSAYLFGGPAIGFNTRARVLDATLSAGADADVQDEIERVEFSAIVGLGVEIRRWFVEARFGAGLTRINKDQTDLDEGLKNRSLAFVAGVRF